MSTILLTVKTKNHEKISIYIFFLCVLFAFQPSEKKMEGTWKMLSYKVVNNGKTAYLVGSQLKTWTKNHVLFVGKFHVNGEDRYNYGSATYSIDETHYTENFIHMVSGANEGKAVKVLLEIKGDTLYQTFPIKDDWSFDKNNYRQEKYVRAE